MAAAARLSSRVFAAGLICTNRAVGYGPRVNPIDRAYDAAESQIMRLRVRSRYFDHLSRAVLRYMDVQGGRLAAAIAYYGFFAVFALLLIGY